MERFFWPGICKHTDTYIKQCQRCVRAKPLISHRTHLHPIVSMEPLDIVCMDYMSLEASKGGYNSILVITDHFSNFAMAIPTTSQTASVTAKILLEHFIYKFGIPRKLLSDQRGSFEAKVIHELAKSHNILKNRTSPYHPECDGKTERLNRSLLNMLRTLENYQKADWKQHLSRLVHAYNCTKHTSTNVSPYFVMFGRQPRLPIDALVPERAEKQANVTEYVQKMREKLQEAYKLAAKNREVASGKQKAYYDKKVYGSCPEVGDLVLVKKHKFDGKHKLADRWEDSVYRIVAGDKPDLPIYRVKPENGPRKE